MTQMECPLVRAVKRFGAREALRSGPIRWTYLDYNKQVNAWYFTLKEIGVGPKSKVAVYSPNHLAYAPLVIAVLHLNAVICPINFRFPPSLVQKILRSINAKFIVTLDKYYHLLTRAGLKGVPLERFTVNKKVGLSSLWNRPVRSEQPLSILFTSGTTDTPKAVLHTYGNHYYSARGANLNIPLLKNSRGLVSLPFYHIGGFALIFRALLGGATLVIPKPGESVQEIILKYPLTHLSLVPTQLYRFLQNPVLVQRLKKMQAVLLGGEPLPESLIAQAIQHGIPLKPTYGMTEMASQISTCKSLNQPGKLNSVGKVLRYREVKISKSGEILVRGKTLFSGYLISNRLKIPYRKSGWFKTGDLGNKDKEGYLFFRGRKDNMFVSGGENIYPEEIEQVLCQIHPIKAAVVVPLPHQEYGYRPIAFILWRRKPLSPPILSKTLEQKLPKFKIPDRFLSWPRIFKKKESKINRQRLIDFAEKKFN